MEQQIKKDTTFTVVFSEGNISSEKNEVIEKLYEIFRLIRKNDFSMKVIVK